jgi:hypothetical protein
MWALAGGYTCSIKFAHSSEFNRVIRLRNDMVDFFAGFGELLGEKHGLKLKLGPPWIFLIIWCLFGLKFICPQSPVWT